MARPNLPDLEPVAPNMAAVKWAVFASVIDRINRALRLDDALRQQVFATLARAEAVMHRVCEIRGLPRFENEHEQRQNTLRGQGTNRRLLAGTVDIACNSWQHTLSPDGRVLFGTDPNDVFPALLLDTAMQVKQASFICTNESSERTSVQCDTQLVLENALHNAAQPVR